MEFKSKLIGLYNLQSSCLLQLNILAQGPATALEWYDSLGLNKLLPKTIN